MKKLTLRTTHTPAVICSCGALLNAATDTETGCAPKPGDFSLCAACGCLYRFDETLTLKALTGKQVAELPDEFKLALKMKLSEFLKEGLD